MNIAFPASYGLIVLAIWLIITGALTALSIGNPTVRIIMGIVAVIAGVLILIGK